MPDKFVQAGAFAIKKEWLLVCRSYGTLLFFLFIRGLMPPAITCHPSGICRTFGMSFFADKIISKGDSPYIFTAFIHIELQTAVGWTFSNKGCKSLAGRHTLYVVP